MKSVYGLKPSCDPFFKDIRCSHHFFDSDGKYLSDHFLIAKFKVFWRKYAKKKA